MYFKLPAASSTRVTSSVLSTSGILRGSYTRLIFFSRSGLSSVCSKKNFKPVSVALIVMLETPASTMWSWNWRSSSAVAVSGERARKRVNFSTARM